nr:tyrosine-type recombinase/integrase [Bacillus safensis]
MSKTSLKHSLYLLAWTGLRAGELAALKWSDIDFKECTISVTKTYYNPSNSTKNILSYLLKQKVLLEKLTLRVKFYKL